MRYYSRIPIFLLIFGLLASLWTAGRRILVERDGRTVELTVDMEQLRDQAVSAGVSLSDSLDALKRAGVASIAVSEQTVGEMEQDGLVQVVRAGPNTGAGVTVVRCPDAGLFRQITDALRLKLRASSLDRASDRARRLPAGVPRSVRIEGADGSELTVPVGWSVVKNMTVGLSADEVALVRGHGLGLVGRIANFQAADDATIPEVARRLRAAGAHTVVFTGDEVLGYRSRVKEAAAALDEQGIRYGSVEFGKQMGDEELSRALQARIVRVHAIQLAELAKLDPAGVVDRFVKAAEERNIRLLYLRLFPYVSDRPFEDNVEYIRSVARELRERGMRLGIAEPLERVYPESRASLAALLAPPTTEPGRGSFAGRLFSRLAPACSALAVAGALVLLLAGVVLTPVGRQSVLALLLGGALGLIVLGGGDLGRKLVALLGALVFPVLAFVWFPVAIDEQQEERSGELGPPSNGATSHSSVAPSGSSAVLARSPGLRLSPLGQFAAMSGVSLLGALTVVGLLSERTFMVKVSSFMGIKAAHSLPLLAIAALYAMGAFAGPWSWPELRRRAQWNIGQILGVRLQLWHLVAGCIAAAIVGMLLARTGNDPGVGVSGTEMSLRNLLDRLLVRPRTKEFLIGHPALLATLLLTARRPHRSVFVPLALLGAIGQVSMVNSFCHLHTPLLMTVVRTINGLWLGVLFGFVLTRLAGRWLPAASSAGRPSTEAIAPPAPARAGSSR